MYRFINHHRRGASVLINNWLLLLQLLENTLASRSVQGDGKLRGILKKLQDLKFLSAVCLYREILEVLATLSLKFERDELLIF